MLFAADLSTTLQTLSKLSVEDLLFPVLVQLAVIIGVARLFGMLARKLGQPTVVGEIFAGIALGPSLFGALFPEFAATIFQPHLHGIDDAVSKVLYAKIFAVISQIGLIFLLFLVGLEFDFEHLKVKGAAAFWVMAVGLTLPFALGYGIGEIIKDRLDHANGTPISHRGFSLFLGTALSITALPTLGRIMIEMGIQRTRLAAIVITAAAIGDAVGWILLATVAAIVKGVQDATTTLIMVGNTVTFVIVMQFVVRPLAIRSLRRILEKNNGQLTLNGLAIIVVLLLLCALATNVIGIFAVFGAFLLGAVLSDQPALREAISTRMRDLVTTFFMPIFFTYTGLRTEILILNDSNLWLYAAMIIAAGLFGKIVGGGLAAYCNGFSRRESAIIGVLMNTRALMLLIVVNAGYDLGVIPKSLFAILVLMAVITTVMCAPVEMMLRRGTEIEEPIRKSGF